MGAVSALADPVRAAVYDIVAAADTPVGRDLVSERAGLARVEGDLELDVLADPVAEDGLGPVAHHDLRKFPSSLRRNPHRVVRR